MSNLDSAVKDINSAPDGVMPASGTDPQAVSGKVRKRIKRAKERAADAQAMVVERGRKTARVANDYAHERPWSTAGVALGVGVLIGLLIARK